MAHFDTLINFKKEVAMVKHEEKLSKFVKQNSAERAAGAENTLKKPWQRRDLNPRPKAYESSERQATNRLLDQPLASFLEAV